MCKNVAHSAIWVLRIPCELQVEGIDQSITTRTKGMVGVSMQSHADRKFQINFNAYVIDSITSMTPATTVDTRTNHHLRGLHLADSKFATPGSVELLIGADIWPCIVLNDVIVGSNYEPCALHTRLGWVVLGPAAANVSEPTSFSYLAGLHDDDSSTDHLLRKFWEIEEPVNSIGPEVDACEEIFVNTVTRHPDGRYIVQIPFRADAPQLGNSHPAALRQFLKLERTLANDYTLRDKYIQFMREYVNLGHMEAIGCNQVDLDNCYYIPHHAVMTKFRVVFNASSKTTNGVSLNDTQMCGSQLQDNLVDILHRFRRYSIALTADIRKMFRQVTTLEGISGSKAPASEINFSNSSTTVLGLRWNPITDTLFFKVKVCNFDTVPTKRIVLSDIARLYDPLGMLAPVVVTAKIFVQNLWLAKLNWDTPLPFELCETWMKYRNSLHAQKII
ncbi:uncharacterized protein LOC128921644 [Zeugodacus cucurbitae]|uniref:uncharacterized protein LOC128921644 n=1 Tax=Zeugodacus cucurbitae TaxID=28588 RepID=UPI0023D92469|nr:uncharacterized protein LOC128921644 [Zeugodacus cucurbitae]